MFPPPVLVPVCHGHDRRVGSGSEDRAIVPFRVQTLTHIRSKPDALFSYQPPFNLMAFLVLWPLRFVVSPRKLHSANVFMIKLTVSIPNHFPFDPSRLTPPRSFNIQLNSDGHRLSPEIGYSLSRPSWPLGFTKGGYRQGNPQGATGKRQAPSITVLGICHSWTPLWGRAHTICTM